jgi:hypothetical protein
VVIPLKYVFVTLIGAQAFVISNLVTFVIIIFNPGDEVVIFLK